MTRPTRDPQELRERAVRLVLEHRDEYESGWAAMRSNAGKLCIGSTETLRNRLRRAEVDGRQRPGETSDERRRLEESERENRGASARQRDPQSPRRPPSGRSSTANRVEDRIPRRAQGPIRGPADLPHVPGPGF